MAVSYYSFGPLRKEDGTETALCAGQDIPSDFVDPVTDAPYLYHVIAEERFEVCVTFQTEVEQKRRYRDVYFDGATGCLRYRWEPVRKDWVMVRP